MTDSIADPSQVRRCLRRASELRREAAQLEIGALGQEREAMTDGGISVADAIYAAIDECDREDDPNGAPVGEVVETASKHDVLNLDDVCGTLADMYVSGDVYKPSDTTIRRFETDGEVKS